MQNYHQNASVVYTDNEGRKIDTFVIFDTDRETGLTHINHENLKVEASALELHPKTVGKYHMPIHDAFSFEILRKLRDKYQAIDDLAATKSTKKVAAQKPKLLVLAQAS